MNSMNSPLFLTIAEVVEIHKDQIEKYGGHQQIRDYKLLCSSVSAPKASWGGQYLHNEIFDMAAAYIYFISQDHPFMDGNKRTALASGLVFLELNGISIVDNDGVLYDVVMDIASGNKNKVHVGDILRSLAGK